MAQLDNLTVLVIFSLTTLTSMVSSRGMMARSDAEIESSISRNLMDENINFAEQVLEIMREKANSEVSRGRESDLIDDEDVLMEDDFYTTHSGRQVRRRRSVPDQKTSGPNDFHPITVALIKINTRELTDILRKNAQRIVSMIEDPERRKKVLSIFELFRFSLHKMTRNLASAQKKEFHEKLVERKMKVHEEAEQPFILDKYTR